MEQVSEGWRQKNEEKRCLERLFAIAHRRVVVARRRYVGNSPEHSKGEFRGLKASGLGRVANVKKLSTRFQAIHFNRRSSPAHKGEQNENGKYSCTFDERNHGTCFLFAGDAFAANGDNR